MLSLTLPTVLIADPEQNRLMYNSSLKTANLYSRKYLSEVRAITASSVSTLCRESVKEGLYPRYDDRSHERECVWLGARFAW